MPTARWYYAQDGEQQGPVTAERVRELLADGELDEGSLVWRSGMQRWTPLTEVNELRPTVGQRPMLPAARLPVLSEEWMARLGRPLLFVGLLLVVAADGCERLGQREVLRREARAELAQRQFQDEWDRRRARLEAAADASDEVRSNGQREAQRAKLDAEMETARENLEQGRWRELRVAARDAEAHQRMWSYWRTWLLLIGMLALAAGLAARALQGVPAERWLCLVLLGVLLLSILVAGPLAREIRQPLP